MFIAIEDVLAGDHIVEGRDKTRVGRIEIECCSSKGTHINGRHCYPRGSIVEVIRRRAENEDDITCPRCGGDHDWCQNVAPDEYGPAHILAVLRGEKDMPPPSKNSPFSDKALFDKLKKQAQTIGTSLSSGTQ